MLLDVLPDDEIHHRITVIANAIKKYYRLAGTRHTTKLNESFRLVSFIEGLGKV